MTEEQIKQFPTSAEEYFHKQSKDGTPWKKEVYNFFEVIKSLRKELKQKDRIINIQHKMVNVVWHDLRKNPQDLPKDNKDVYVATLSPYEEKENAYEYGFDSWNGEDWFFTAVSDVVAWRETPTFEE